MAANPNTIPKKTVWSKVFQLSRYKAPVYGVIAKMDLKAQLEDGDTLKRTYSSDMSSGKMGGNGSYNTRARTNVEESITIDQKDYTASQFPSWEKLLWALDNDKQFAQDSSARLHLQTDASILNTVRAGANNTMDDGTIGGTSGNGIAAAIGNILAVFSTANELLRLGNAEYPANVPFTGNVKLDMSRKKKVAILDPHTINILEQYLAGKGTPLGDQTSNEGFVTRFMGFNVFSSNNLPFQAVLTLAALPTDGDTISIGGVTLTFRTTQGSSAGSINIADSVDNQLTALAAFLAAPFTTVAEAAATGYNALTATEIDTVAKELIWGKPGDSTDAQVNISGTADTSADTLTVTIKGVNKVTVAETLTNASSVWTTEKQTVTGIFCISGCVDLIMKRDPNIEVNPVAGAIAKDFVNWNLWGSKVFRDQAPQIVAAKFQASSITAPTQTF